MDRGAMTDATAYRAATPWCDDGDQRLYEGDCVDVMPTIGHVDAIITDPPYGLGFMEKDWDSFDGSYQEWCETWAGIALGVLKPGGHILAFGGTRTFHRLTCALEDAGFEIRDCLMWLYGSGFPKSHNIGNGWGTALKPAWEPIVLARKPLTGTVSANVARDGTGALNIDACRIPGGDPNNLKRLGRDYTNPDTNFGTTKFGQVTRAVVGGSPLGRWPANIMLDEEASAQLDEQSGERGSSLNQPYDGQDRSLGRNGIYGDGNSDDATVFGYYDSGGASRFFYTAKASRSERNHANHHPTVKPLALMRWLVRLVTPPGGVILDPFVGSGTTLVAARAEGFRGIGIDCEEDYLRIAAGRLSQLSLLGGSL